MASIQLTDDDVGKPVVTGSGGAVGLISGYRHGTAYVDPDPGIATKLKTKLGWEETDEDGYPLQSAEVATVTEDEVRLRSDL